MVAVHSSEFHGDNKVRNFSRVGFWDNQNGDVLVIEDDHDTAVYLKWILEQAGFRVCLAENRDDALLNIKMAKFNLVLMDIYMPGLDADTFVSVLRQTHPCHLILTSAGPDLAEMAQRLSVTHWLRKAAIPDRLLDMIESL